MIPVNLLPAPDDRNGRFYGVTVGLVTNNKDDEGLGRVKVKFPWLSDTDESYWARIVTPMAGKERGLYFIPEVNDEVLVAFEHGMIEFPYILGALWNGQDKPPLTNKDGKNDQRAIVSRSGHQIILDDKENEEKIIIRDKTKKNEIVIDSKNNTMTVKVEKDITIEAKGNISIATSDGDMSIKCKKLAVETEDCDIKAKNKLAVEAKNSDIKAGSKLAVKANKCEMKAKFNVNSGTLEVP